MDPVTLEVDSQSPKESTAYHTKRLPGSKSLRRHAYIEDIEALIAAGTSLGRINGWMAQIKAGQQPPYVPVSLRALQSLKARLRTDRLRPRPLWERELADEHALLDTVMLRSKLVQIQMARLDKALAFERDLQGKSGSEFVLVDAVQGEIETLSRLMAGYEDVMERVGLLGATSKSEDGQSPATQVKMEVNLYDEFAARVKQMPEALQGEVVRWLHQAREGELARKRSVAQRKALALLPASTQGGEDTSHMSKPDAEGSASAGRISRTPREL